MKKKWIVAVSSGPDSMALLHMLYKQNIECVVAHVNYHQRSTSDRDEKTVRDYAKSLNIKVEVRSFQQKFDGNFQNIARLFRYKFFKELVIKHDAQCVAVAHHLDDDLETYLMQKQSDRTTKFPGIQETTKIEDVLVYRPLLHLSKEDIIQYCHEHELPYETDESNLELNYTRNKVRHQISTMDDTQKKELYQEFLDSKQDKILYLKTLPKLSNPFDIETYKDIEKDKRVDVLRFWLEANGAKPFDFSKRYLEDIDTLIMGGKAHHPMNDLMLSVSYGTACLYKEEAYSYVLNELEYIETKHFKTSPTGNVIEGITLKDTDFPITIRNYKAGDKIKLRFGTKSVNRFFIDRKIPSHLRNSWLVVENSVKEVIFVHDLGCDVYHYSNNPNVFMVKLGVS